MTTGNWGGPSVRIEIGSRLRMGESSEMKLTCIRLGEKMSDYLSLIISVLDKLLRGLDAIECLNPEIECLILAILKFSIF